jgi:pimeloyl-ACP methyl ester carboxylesterase
MPTIACEGATFFFEERGSGRPLLLVPGTGGHTGAVAGVAERLATSHRAISYDRRGHSRTSGDPGKPAGYLRRHVADAAALLRALRAEPAIVFGWSWGGIVALGLAIDNPELVRALVLQEPPLHAKKHPTLALAGGIGGAILLGKLGMHRRGAVRFARFALERNDGTNAFDDLDPAMRESLLANARTIIAELEAGTGEELSTEAIGRVSCPTAIVVGDRSQRFLADAAQRLHAAVPASHLVRIAGGDHLMTILQPEELSRAIAAFAETVP